MTITACVLAALTAADVVLISMRLVDSPLRKPDFFKASCEVHAKYRGAFDEFWYGGGKPLCRTEFCRADLRKMAELRPWVERAGMALSFQQGLTLGHDYEYIGKVRRCLCPRSPAVLDYVARYVKVVLEELRPATGRSKTSCSRTSASSTNASSTSTTTRRSTGSGRIRMPRSPARRSGASRFTLRQDVRIRPPGSRASIPGARWGRGAYRFLDAVRTPTAYVRHLKESQ